MQQESQHDWSRAPADAIYWAADADGRAYYYSADIFPNELRGVWCFTDFALHPHWTGGVIKLDGTDWRATKRWKARPSRD